jgi:hypothetical protein
MFYVKIFRVSGTESWRGFCLHKLWQKVTRAIQTSKLPRSCVSCGIGQLLVLLLLAGFVYLGCSRSSQIPASANLISKRVREKYDGVIGTEALPLLLNKRNNVNPPELINGKASLDVSMSVHHNDTVSLI